MKRRSLHIPRHKIVWTLEGATLLLVFIGSLMLALTSLIPRNTITPESSCIWIPVEALGHPLDTLYCRGDLPE